MKGFMTTIILVINALIIGALTGGIWVMYTLIDMEFKNPGKVDRILFSGIRNRGKDKKEKPEDKVVKSPVGFKMT